MKKVILISIVMMLMLVGCGNSQPKPKRSYLYLRDSNYNELIRQYFDGGISLNEYTINDTDDEVTIIIRIQK